MDFVASIHRNGNGFKRQPEIFPGQMGVVKIQRLGKGDLRIQHGSQTFAHHDQRFPGKRASPCFFILRCRNGLNRRPTFRFGNLPGRFTVRRHDLHGPIFGFALPVFPNPCLSVTT